MNGHLFTYTAAFLLLVLIVSVYVKRSWSVDYDRKAILSAFIAFIVTGVIHFTSDLDVLALSHASIPHKVYATIIIVLAANAIVQFVFWFLFTVIRYRGWVKMPRFLFNFFAFFIFIGAILACIKFIFNTELSGLLVTSTVLSAIIGLALQDTLSSLFAGISLNIESPFSIDDWVNLGGYEGKVVSQNWRTVTILTRQNHRVSLTNKFIAEDKIVNFSRPTRRQIHNFYIELDYNHPPNRVKVVLKDLLNEIDEVELDENLGVFVVDYMESGIKYCLRYWLYDYADILHIQDMVLSRLWYALKRHDIKIPYPTSEVQMYVLPDLDTESIKVSDEAVLHFLTNLKWLAGMTADNIAKVAQESRLRLFAKDDLIVRQGEEGSSMFIIITGGVKVLVKSVNNHDIEIARKGSGEFFGEMSLLTGQPRTASIRAIEDTKVLVLDKECFSTLIISDEKILSEFVEVLVECESGIKQAIDEERQGSNITEESAHKIIFKRILDYFKLNE